MTEMDIALPKLPMDIAVVINRLAGSGWLYTIPALQAETVENKLHQFQIFFENYEPLTSFCVVFEMSGKFGKFTLTLAADLINELSNVFLPGWRAESSDCCPFEWRALYLISTLFPDIVTDPEMVTVTPQYCPEQVDSPNCSHMLCGHILWNDEYYRFNMCFLLVAKPIENITFSGLDRIDQFAITPNYLFRMFLSGRTVEWPLFQSICKGDVILINQMQNDYFPVTLRVPDTALEFQTRLHLDGSLSTIDIAPKAGRGSYE